MSQQPSNDSGASKPKDDPELHPISSPTAANQCSDEIRRLRRKSCEKATVVHGLNEIPDSEVPVASPASCNPKSPLPIEMVEPQYRRRELGCDTILLDSFRLDPSKRTNSQEDLTAGNTSTTKRMISSTEPPRKN